MHSPALANTKSLLYLIDPNPTLCIAAYGCTHSVCNEEAKAFAILIKNTSRPPAFVSPLKSPNVYPVVYTDPSLDVATPLPYSLTVVPNNFVQTFVPSDEYFVTKTSELPAFISPSKSPLVYPVINTDPSLDVATPSP